MESISRSTVPSGHLGQATQLEGRFAGPKATWWSAYLRVWRLVLAHLDALRFNPVKYLGAVFWRLRGFKVRSRHRMAPLLGLSPHAYQLWMARNAAPGKVHTKPSAPIDIIPIVDCRSGSNLAATLASIARAGNVQPILIGGAPTAPVRRVEHPRDLVKYLPNGGWICPLNSGDLLAPAALHAYALAIDEFPAVRLFYSDDDLIEASGRRHSPHFKPKWNSELFCHHDFLSGGSAIQIAPERLALLPDDGWIEAAVAEAVTDASPMHLPLVLHHRQSRPAPVAPAAFVPTAANPSRVSVIIPTRDHADLLRNCVDGLDVTDYPDVEIIVVDNGSVQPDTLNLFEELKGRGHTVLARPGPFNYSKLNNDAVRHTNGNIICFLNNDVEMIDRHWLSLMVRNATRSDVGAVGALLLYPDRTVQHAGVCIGIGGGAGHAHRHLGEFDNGYFERARLPQFVSAVTGACMVVEREKFLAVGGFEEELFPVAFNDVDLCLKLNGQGWQSFYEPRARLIHHESKTRGHDSLKRNRSRFADELAALKAKWNTDQRRDPFHHPELSLYSEQFVVAV